MKVITISGKAQHGKSTAATYLKKHFESRGAKVLITNYGDLLKYICRQFFGWNGEKDEYGRSLLQHVGTDVVRTKSPDLWVEFVTAILRFFPDQWDYVLIPDTRFPNEVELPKAAGLDVSHLRIIRDGFVSPLTPEQQAHISETALDDARPDYVVRNDGTLEDFRQKLVELADAEFV